MAKFCSKAGEKNGPYQEFYPNGKIRAKGAYHEGCRNGQWVFYSEDGQEKRSGKYLCDQEVGHWTEIAPLIEQAAKKKETERRSEKKRVHLAVFQFNGITSVQSVARWAASVQASWNPYFFLSRRISAKGALGVTAFKSMDTGKFFPAIEYGMLFSFASTRSLILELGPGGETWFGNGGTAPVVLSQLLWRFSRLKLGVIESLFVGYSAFFFGPGFVHQVKAGFGVSL